MVRERTGGGSATSRLERCRNLPVDESGRTGGRHARPRRLPPPGILELEDLLSDHLNTRVKVDLSAKRGKVVVEFATLEDLERIYKLMVGSVDQRACSLRPRRVVESTRMRPRSGTFRVKSVNRRSRLSTTCA